MYRNPAALARPISGAYLTERDAEQALIMYLRSTDKFGKAIYPTYG